MIDNFKIISEMLSFKSDDEFYFVQILKRKKENRELGSNSYVVKTYYIRSHKHLELHRPEMIELANFHNARVYINLNKRSFEKMAFHCLKKISDIIMNKDYVSISKAYNSVCGLYSEKDDKSWIIDIDEKVNLKYGRELLDHLKSLQPIGEKFINWIETKNGYHLIVKPFDISQFDNKKYPLEIHKNNPTILYCP